MFEEKIKGALAKATGKKEIALEISKQGFGDFAYPCFELAREMKKNPAEIAKDIVKKIKLPKEISKAEAAGGYVNFFADKEMFSEKVISEVLKEKGKYGASSEGKGKNIVIDFSSPNIAKPFHIGHLRSTVIGGSLYRIYNFLGYKSIGINHLGDWGTQFGQLIYAYKKWGSENGLKKNPIKYLLGLYIMFNEKLTEHPELQEEARKWFKKLEMGDKEALKLWKTFSELSLNEFNKIYSMLNVKFDYVTGESFYNDRIKKTVELLKSKKVTEESQDALIVNLDRYGMAPCIIEKSDGASSYATRDIAAAIYRNEKYHPEKILYVIGSEQNLHFGQVFRVLDLAGFTWYSKCVHVPFGMIRLPEGKMSTRKGNVVFMEDVIEKGIELASNTIKEKNPDLKDKDKVAKAVAIGAIIYNDLSTDRILDIVFDWGKALSFEGNSGPYIQYSYVRANSILKKIKQEKGKANFKNLDEKEYALIKELSFFQKEVKEAAENYKPSIIANYAYKIARLFNDFYEACPVLSAEPKAKFRRILLVRAAKQVLENCFNLLLIPVVEEM